MTETWNQQCIVSSVYSARAFLRVCGVGPGGVGFGGHWGEGA